MEDFSLEVINSKIWPKDLFDLFIAQLKKDFEGANCDSVFSQNLIPNYNEILLIIEQELTKISKTKPSKINAVLYRIDISEQQIQNKKSEHPNENFYLIISELIIKRTLQKVVIKEYYKKKSG